MRLYNWFGEETFIYTIAIIQRPMLYNTVYHIYVYTAASVTTATTTTTEPDRVVITFEEGCEMGRKNETTRLKINANNGWGMRRLYACTIPLLYVLCIYIILYTYVFFPPPPPT